MSSQSERARRVGFVASGPGFYVWEPSREEARRSARDLSPRSAQVATPVRRLSSRTRRSRTV